MVDRGEVRRLGHSRVQAFDDLVGIIGSSDGRGLLRTPKPDVVRDVAKQIVPRISTQYSTKAIFEIITTTSLEPNAVDVEPSSPEEPAKPVHVAIDDPTSVIPAAQIND